MAAKREEEKKGGGESPVTLRILGCLIEDGSNDLSNDCPTIPQQMICQIQRSNYLKVLGTLAANKSNDLVQQLRKSGPRLSTPYHWIPLIFQPFFSRYKASKPSTAW